MKLKPYKHTDGFRKWCGPTALSILTGRSIGYCAKLGAKFRNVRYALRYTRCYIKTERPMTPKMVKGMANEEVIACLGTMGFKAERLNMGTRTLFRIMEEMGTADWRSAILWNVTNHYVVTQLGIVYDNHTTEGADYRKFWCRRRKVVEAWVITAK